jgi:gamma-glutamylcyclotransferase (GGCT)/AIG2-like uncharacterized protein YtfP
MTKQPRLYFAYGSNLNHAQFYVRCPGAKAFGRVVLPNYRLYFRGVADIGPSPGDEVWGGIYKITPACERALDRYEGFPHLYRKESFYVEVKRGADKDFLEVMYYTMNTGLIEAPGRYYYSVIEQGYKDWGLDLSHLGGALRRCKEEVEQAEAEERCYVDEAENDKIPDGSDREEWDYDCSSERPSKRRQSRLQRSLFDRRPDRRSLRRL